ncbi:type VII secretion protein EccCa [Nocardia terpenica]|uniref:type VII secretion protein EccCa n=1 Tax=Nocardia terpenica TaxID=455432 RepID=UPI001895BAE4|nr:type VII secretion protein EccCa [Nocardia terpenica]MBF6061740.1 type VII secretion protein EccCa [Nocardia terpenica]MBF6107465.1 type VII secretion protein EccCa [Nocardia terpenica]MBF6110160.1 type VII secretion protein EccCa [Nocardia terpenica]MBF6122328.1 type VII secretion protein EccCa [Nocardia terpenica]MBF6151496.1 type VII secretion protein EccCa [Nocardia terpenica]
MSTVRFQRRQRREVPRSPGGEVTLQPPPEIPRAIPGSLISKLMPVVMIVGMVGMMAIMFTRGGGIASNPMSMMFPMMMVFSMVGMFAGQGGRGQKAAEANEDRKDYLRYLDQVRKDVDETSQQQRAAVEWSHPEPGLIWMLAGTSRMWERRPGDKDFCHARIGLGGQRLATRLVSPETGPVEELEPIAAVSLRRFVRTHSTVPDLPTAIAVKGFATIQLNGDRAQARDMTRAMLLQLCMFQAPDQVLIAVVCGADTAREWEWIKWLPHTQHPESQDGVGTERMVYGSVRAMAAGLHPLLHNRVRYSRNQPANQNLVHIIIVVDGGLLEAEEDALRESGYEGVTVIDLCNYAPRLAVSRGIQMVVENGECVGRGATGTMERFALIDRISARQAEQVARRLAPFRVAVQRGGETVAEEAEVISTWSQLMSLGDIGTFNPENAWKPRYGRDRLRVPFGVGADGLPVHLDIKEAAENGMGPHGLCIGATGSGKSEFLRTLVLSLLATHSPDQLNFVLVDFKGGATFLGLEGVPHVAAVITNLEEEADLVDRMRDALAGEMNRRQELLRSSGNYINVTEYEKARAAGADLDPMPALFVVLDEFSELLAQHPDFAELFVMIGRLGRSLHVHLLLASQRLEEGRLKGLESHLSYRIGLKTFSANESRQVLGVPDAYNLPNNPGGGYLKSDSGEIQRFQASYVSGPYVGGGAQREITQAGIAGGEIDINAREFTADHVDFRPADRIPLPQAIVEVEESREDAEKISNLQMLVSRIRGHGRPAHEIWLPPLNESPTLEWLIPRSVLTGEYSAVATLRTSIGLVDRPYEQRREPMVIDLSGAQGNVAVVGGPQSGKSTALRTLIMAMSMTHTAEQVQFYCLDFGGGTLAGLAGLPHVGSVASRLDEDMVRRTIAEMQTIVRQRELRFRQMGIESMADFRRLRGTDPSSSAAAAGAHNDPFGDVFLVIDGFGSIRQDFDSLEQPIMNLAVQGLSYGVHVVVALSRWMDVRPALKDQIGTRIELRLGDPMDSDFGRKVAALVPQGRPGRGITADHKHMLTALPRVDGNPDPSDLATGVANAVATIAARTGGRPAPRVRMLPDSFTRDELLGVMNGWPAGLDPSAYNLQIPIGLDEAELAPVTLNFAETPHFLVFGDSECGKTNLLRTICQGIVQSNTKDRAMLILADYRRTMLGLIETDHLAGYAPSDAVLAPMVSELARILRGRMPGPDVTQQELRDRSWWSGPELYVVVDDYDMVVTSAGNPLAPLVEFLAHAKDIGFHLVVARRAGGAARAMYDPMLSRMRDVGTTGLIMSGSREEGQLFGTVRPSAMPPGRGTLITRAGVGLVQIAWSASR